MEAVLPAVRPVERGLIATPAGRYTERQAYALSKPCRSAREWDDAGFRHIIHRGQVAVYTFLSFDWFEHSKPVWHASVAILVGPGRLKRLEHWTHNDVVAALRLATELIQGAGDVQKGRHAYRTVDSFDLYRAATPLEAAQARAAIDRMEPPPPFLTVSGLPKVEEWINGRTAELGADGSGAQTSRADGGDAPIIRRTKITAEAIRDA